MDSCGRIACAPSFGSDAMARPTAHRPGLLLLLLAVALLRPLASVDGVASVSQSVMAKVRNLKEQAKESCESGRNGARLGNRT